jgi:hypothetical protein
MFGFASSPPGESGDLLLKILVPDTITNPSLVSYGVSGFASGTADLVSTTPWTSGFLADFLGLSASPANPIGAYLPSTQGFDPAATGFFVYEANLGTQTLPGPGSESDAFLMTLNRQIPQGSYIVGFINEGNDTWQATANSGAIFETSSQAPIPESSTWAMMLLGFAGLSFAGFRRAKKESISALA